MTRSRGGYGHRVNIVRFHADDTLNARLQEIADENQSAKARVVREMVLFALAEGFRGSQVRSTKAPTAES